MENEIICIGEKSFFHHKEEEKKEKIEKTKKKLKDVVILEHVKQKYVYKIPARYT